MDKIVAYFMLYCFVMLILLGLFYLYGYYREFRNTQRHLDQSEFSGECPHCHKTISIKKHFEVAHGECPHCHKVIRLNWD